MVYIKKASLENIAEIIVVFKEFIEESSWDLSFDEKSSINTLFSFITSDDCEVFYSACKKGRVTGVATVVYDQDFCKERTGYLTKFYIRESGRKTKASRELIKTCVNWWELNDCKYSYATATASIKGQSNLFENLLSKFNFNKCGDTMVLDHG